MPLRHHKDPQTAQRQSLEVLCMRKKVKLHSNTTRKTLAETDCRICFLYTLETCTQQWWLNLLNPLKIQSLVVTGPFLYLHSIVNGRDFKNSSTLSRCTYKKHLSTKLSQPQTKKTSSRSLQLGQEPTNQSCIHCVV